MLLARAVGGVSMRSGHPASVPLPWYQVAQTLAKIFLQLVFVPVASCGAWHPIKVYFLH